jgi:aspartate/methionine/tyrosine aminotransferase
LSSAADLLGAALFDEDDIMLVPSPYYFLFSHDFGYRNLNRIVGVPMYTSKDPIPKLNVLSFDRKYKELEQDGQKVKAILLTNPNNPEGHYFTLDELQPVIEWAYR